MLDDARFDPERDPLTIFTPLRPRTTSSKTHRVWLCERPDGSGQVYVKIWSRRTSALPWMQERFQRALPFLRNAVHPSLPRVLVAGRAEGRLYVVTDEVKGHWLPYFIEHKGGFSPVEVARKTAQLASALELAAAFPNPRTGAPSGVHHGLLLAGHVYFDEAENPVVLGLGHPRRTRYDDPRDDVWLLGSLARLLLRREAFLGAGRAGELLSILDRAAGADRDDRHESARELRLELEDFADRAG